MPTAAKLVAAVVLAGFMYLAALNYFPNLPEGTQVGRMAEIAAAFGFLTGWLSVGPSPIKTFAEAVSAGLKGVIIATFMTLLFAGIWTMAVKSMRMMYDGPMDAAVGIFAEMLDYGLLMGTPGVVGSLLVGAVATGMLTRFASQRWR